MISEEEIEDYLNRLRELRDNLKGSDDKSEIGCVIGLNAAIVEARNRFFKEGEHERDS